MDLVFDESFFTKVIIILLIAIAITGALAIIIFSGIFNGEDDPGLHTGPVVGGDEPYQISPQQGDSELVTGMKSYAWSYNDIPMEMEIYIPKEIYNAFLIPSYGSEDEIPSRFYEYIITDGDAGIIRSIADWFFLTSLSSGFGDTETIENVLAFVEHLDYTIPGEREGYNGPLRYPVITLAEEEGDSTDKAILAAAILDTMGYGVSLLHYPATYDRRSIIPQATALGLITDASYPGVHYLVIAETSAGRFAYYPGNETTLVTQPKGTDPDAGWYSGEAIARQGTDIIQIGEILYYPGNETFRSEEEIANASEIVIEDALWHQPVSVSAIWVVDTEEKGVANGAYDGIKPLFIGKGGIWRGKTVIRDDRMNTNTTIAGKTLLDNEQPFQADETLAEVLRIPVAGIDTIPWQRRHVESIEEYYGNVWYPSGISWRFDDSWNLHEKFLSFDDTLVLNPGSYTLHGTTEVASPVPWRITYTIDGMDKDHSEKEMTPYSDLRIVIYRIIDSTAVYERVSGWQTLYSGAQRESVAPFAPGDYAVAVFVRNCRADVSIEYYGKYPHQFYQGGI
ncbi:hypothetical protein [Methanocalculus sp.]|uniref:hypothetical protein n=1 Tax=Methanocalculus sp. TaxID=2004547 RepID=UPI00271577C1|nr:hypothetical protein [Methanocalculus sp.]MDO8841290.1 hypothetical protein [Methanocalculus sp.]